MRLGAACLLLALGIPSPSMAQTSARILESSFLLEAKLIEADADRYVEARRLEVEAFEAFSELGEHIDELLADAQLPTDQLRESGLDLSVSLATANARSRESADLRRQLILRMERLLELGAEIERQRDRALVKTGDLEGFWRIEITPYPGFGLLELRFDGTLVTGTYRFSNGDYGSVRGTYTNHLLRLERIEARRGLDGTMEGEHDSQSGVIRGVWQSSDVTRDERGVGRWTAHKLSPTEPEVLDR